MDLYDFFGWDHDEGKYLRGQLTVILGGAGFFEMYTRKGLKKDDAKNIKVSSYHF